jgi:hypothetical protein
MLLLLAAKRTAVVWYGMDCHMRAKYRLNVPEETT